jgi:hypothetical protein
VYYLDASGGYVVVNPVAVEKVPKLRLVWE